jgi:hypothetical protein
MWDVPPSRSDRQLLLITATFLAIAAVVALGLVLLATQRNAAGDGPFYIGTARTLERSITKDSPLYFANPTAGDGFWLDVERGELVALVIDRPGLKDCVVKWKEQRGAYVDCNDEELASEELDRYKVTIGSRNGSPKNSVYINLRKVSPAPGAEPAA